MNLNLLNTFIKVANCGSLTKASKLLNHPKSKISRDLDKLEDELEQSLLKRTPRGITLTEQGYNLLHSTRSQLEQLESSILKAKSDQIEIKGNIKLTASEDLSSFMLTRLISDFMKIYPDVSVELYSATEFLDFQKYNIDLALRIGKLSDSNLVQRKITDIDVIYVCSAYYAKLNNPVKKMSDLKDHNIALIKDVHANQLNRTILKGIQPKFSSNSMSVLKDFVNCDSGIGTLPKFLCQKEIITKEFIHILPKETYISRGLYLLSAPATYTSKHVKIFKDYIFESMQMEF